MLDEQLRVWDCKCMTGFGPMHAEDEFGLMGSTLSLLYTPTPILSTECTLTKKNLTKKKNTVEMLKHDNAANSLN